MLRILQPASNIWCKYLLCCSHATSKNQCNIEICLPATTLLFGDSITNKFYRKRTFQQNRMTSQLQEKNVCRHILFPSSIYYSFLLSPHNLFSSETAQFPPKVLFKPGRVSFSFHVHSIDLCCISSCAYVFLSAANKRA